MNRHCFAICAYKESRYLESCIRSVLDQRVKTSVILVTSTPNDHIRDLCKKYDIPMFINEGKSGITQDWNYAYSVADAEFVTITHQDDIYRRNYTEKLFEYIDKAQDPIIFFSDYAEIRNGKRVDTNKILTIKRIMLLPLRIKALWSSRFIRRRILSLGSPICCPSVTFVKRNCPKQPFQNGFRADEDWQAWERLSKQKGAFVFCSGILMYHRIHKESETSKILGDNARSKEDLIMFKKFWPDPIAKLLSKWYSSSEKSNEL